MIVDGVYEMAWDSWRSPPVPSSPAYRAGSHCQLCWRGTAEIFLLQMKTVQKTALCEALSLLILYLPPSYGI